MPQLVTLNDSSSQLDTRDRRNIFANRISSNGNELKSLSFGVYSSRHMIPTEKQVRMYRPEEHILPPLDKRRQHKAIRPFFRSPHYRSKKPIIAPADFSSLTARGTRSEIFFSSKDYYSTSNLEYHHVPPPSPSDDQLERILNELTRTRRCTPDSPRSPDGNIPFRLPALQSSSRTSHLQTNTLPKICKTTLSNYSDRFF